MTKLKDGDFLKTFKENDIICLQETWTSSPITFEGYSVFELPAPKFHTKGRQVGSFGILIRSAFQARQVFIANGPCNVLAIKLSFTEQHIILINIYIPPSQTKCVRVER